MYIHPVPLQMPILTSEAALQWITDVQSITAYDMKKHKRPQFVHPSSVFIQLSTNAQHAYPHTSSDCCRCRQGPHPLDQVVSCTYTSILQGFCCWGPWFSSQTDRKRHRAPHFLPRTLFSACFWGTPCKTKDLGHNPHPPPHTCSVMTPSYVSKQNSCCVPSMQQPSSWHTYMGSRGHCGQPRS